MYCHISPLGENIHITFKPFPMDALVHMEDDIEWAMRRMKSNRSGGPSGMRAEHLHKCLWEEWEA